MKSFEKEESFPGVSKECFLEALKCLKTSKKPFETPGLWCFVFYQYGILSFCFQDYMFSKAFGGCSCVF